MTTLTKNEQSLILEAFEYGYLASSVGMNLIDAKQELMKLLVK